MPMCIHYLLEFGYFSYILFLLIQVVSLLFFFANLLIFIQILYIAETSNNSKVLLDGGYFNGCEPLHGLSFGYEENP